MERTHCEAPPCFPIKSVGGPIPQSPNGLTLRVRKFRIFVVILLALLPAAQAQILTRRQSAPVMGVGGADWLTRPERIQEEEPDRMLPAREIQTGATVADIGAGVGYHVWRLSAIVGPRGKPNVPCDRCGRLHNTYTHGDHVSGNVEFPGRDAGQDSA